MSTIDEGSINSRLQNLEDVEVNEVIEEKDTTGIPPEGGVEEEVLEGSDCSKDDDISRAGRERKSLVQKIVEDFHSSQGGDHKILRAICRTATVNAAILATAATGGAAIAPVVGFATGGAIAAKRLSDGILHNNEREISKSLAVYGGATCASMAGQALAGTVMITVFHAALPLVVAVAFGVGCCSGITAGAVSEWTVDCVIDGLHQEADKCVSVGSSASGTWSELKQTWTTLFKNFHGSSRKKSLLPWRHPPPSSDQVHQTQASKNNKEDCMASTSDVSSSSNQAHPGKMTSCSLQFIQSSDLLSYDLAWLIAEKTSLHQTLCAYENDFYQQHKRHVSCFDDIRLFESQYRQYKEIEIAIEQKS